jgi:hypothetical protein
MGSVKDWIIALPPKPESLILKFNQDPYQEIVSSLKDSRYARSL